MSFRASRVLLASASLLALTTGQASAQQSGGAVQLDAISAEGQGGNATTRGAGGGQGAPAVDGTPGVVTNDGYVAKTTRSATKTNTPINETPQTINTVTQKQLDDRKPQNLQDALAYTPGVRVGAFGFDPRYDSFFIRGVDVTYTGVFRDGLRQFNSPNGMFRLEPYGLESISILKGPASAIYGASASSGIVDLISKRPTDYKFGEIGAETGSFNRMQANIDVGGPANDAGTVLWRFTGLARNSDTEVNFAKDDRVYIAPAVTFRPSDRTELTLLAEYMRSVTGGSVAYQNVYRDARFLSVGATKKQLAQGDFNDFTQDQGRIGYEFKHQFSDAVTFHSNARFSALGTRQEYNGEQPYPFLGYVDRQTGLIKENLQGFSADNFFVTEVRTGPLAHKILTGVDFSYLKYDSRQGFGVFTDPDDIDTPSFDDPSNYPRRFDQKQTLVGVYAQDEIALDKWRLTIGGRHDWYDSTFHSDLRGIDGTGAVYRTTDTQKQNGGKFTGRAALSYVTDFGLTPYTGYATSFVPNPGTVIDGTVTRPTTGEQVEAGVKYAVPGYNATINASVFWLKQNDGVVYAVVSGQNQQTQLDFRSRGFELDANATLANGVTLQATYAYTDTKILKLTEQTEGKKVTNIPEHAFSVWAGYDFKEGPLVGLGAGAGVRFTGWSEGDNLNRAVIANKPRAFVDAKLSYDLEKLDPKLKGLSAQLNATNLLDTVEEVCSSNYCYFDKGRQVIASIRYRW